MKPNVPRKYNSTLREAQARQTRERILEAVAGWMQTNAFGDFTFDEIADLAGVERRTVFRHFSSKEALLEAFWIWINHKLVPNPLPSSESDLINGPRTAFAKFDELEGVMRGSLHTRAGRAMRMATVAARRESFRKALSDVAATAKDEDLSRLEAIAHALYSAAAWETMRDYADLDGARAGEAASWALAVLTEFVRNSGSSRTQDKEKEK